VYDGNGKVEGLFSFNFNGFFVVSPPEPSSGTYTVKANCTGTTTYISQRGRDETDLFIAPDGSMFKWVQTNPPRGWRRGLNCRERPSESETEPLRCGSRTVI
jgi:hypothetical protein